jgi:alpha/beta superfamily hydrolase
VIVDIPGPAGRLEAILEEPSPTSGAQPAPAHPERGGARGAAESKGARFAALVCHPHPRFGGTKNNHATYRLAKAVRAEGGVALRFDFRGVGRSAGSYGAGSGEVDDARAALEWLAAARPGLPLVACGFSFGAWMALFAGADTARVSGLLLAGLALRAPDLDRFRDSGRVREVEKPIAIVQAERDEFGTPEEVEAALRGSRGPRRLAAVRGATHLFTEDLPALEREARAAIGWLTGGSGP